MKCPRHKMIEAIYMAHDVNQTIIAFINQIVAEVRQSPSIPTRAAQSRRRCSRRIREIVTPAGDGRGGVYR